MSQKTFRGVLLATALAAVASGGYWIGKSNLQPGDAAAPVAAAAETGKAPAGERNTLYWYDPMYPQQHFDKPGKSPFMDMALVPKYADDDGGGAGIKIDPVLAQNLGVRYATVESGRLDPTIEAVASVGFNERDVAIIQARTAGFVERVYARAPGDVVATGAALADVLVPEWASAQSEYLALRAAGEKTLVAATRERLKLLGMPSDLIERVERTHKPSPVITITTPIAGVIQTLDVRAGMTVSTGMTLARVNGLSTVWLEAAVPEAQAGGLAPGAAVEARLPALSGEVFKGKVAAILPQANTDTRTLRVRAEIPNPQDRLRPGLFAQMRIVTNAAADVLLIPSEAVIRTGKRTLAIVADDNHRFQSVEIEAGADAGGKTVVLKGLTAGQKIVVSGQFLIDSEASLKGVLGRMQPDAAPAADAPLHEAEGKVVSFSADEITLAHGPVPTMNWGAMTMPFKLRDPTIAKELKAGDRVKFAFRQNGDVFVVERLERVGDAS
ncbi:MAG: efflux RND transporter periplasmic adaptor subunit [Gammaproteobacteria bacterium]|nr:efflux RND transporter periplasmic adaptor subunit [Gammaproteobacteria bacterium]